MSSEVAGAVEALLRRCTILLCPSPNLATLSAAMAQPRESSLTLGGVALAPTDHTFSCNSTNPLSWHDLWENKWASKQECHPSPMLASRQAR